MIGYLISGLAAMVLGGAIGAALAFRANARDIMRRGDAA